ncbi:MAG: hypothetical protein ACPGXK_06295 [Phycisphaerae bacterium]
MMVASRKLGAFVAMVCCVSFQAASWAQQCPPLTPVDACGHEKSFDTNPCCAEGMPNPTCSDFSACGVRGSRVCSESMQACSVDGDCPMDESCCSLGEVNPAFDCRWRPISDAMMSGTCGSLADPVDRRLCDLGILLDGDLQDGLDNGAIKLVDQVTDQAGNLPEECGDFEEPLETGDPSGLNIAHGVLLFSPDSDSTDGEDDSFIYVGIDISDFTDDDGQSPVPFDLDDNGSACLLAEDVFDNLRLYQAFIQSCADLEEDNLCEVAPADIDNKVGRDLAITLFDPSLGVPLTPMFARGCMGTASPAQVSIFPTADGVTNPSLACIDSEICNCANRSNGDGNNLEIIVRSPETAGLFGQHAIATPDSAEARANRMALSQLLVSLFGGAVAADADEDLANIKLRTSIPDLEVTKTVRCVGQDQVFGVDDVSLAIFDGQEVEFEISITNLGNENVDVDILDVLENVGAAGVTCEPICDSLNATFTSPQLGVVDEMVTPANAEGFGLNDAFFVGTNPCSPIPGAFLPNLGSTVNLGLLRGAIVERTAVPTCTEPVCTVTEGDRITFTYRATVNVANPVTVCAVPGDDCENTVTVTGNIEGANDSVEVTVGPIGLDAVCRNVTVDKRVSIEGGAPQNGPAPLGSTDTIATYIYTVSNEGSRPEMTTIEDTCLCNTVNATPGVSFGNCTLCTQQGGSITWALAPDASQTITCEVLFADADAVQAYVMSDDARPECCSSEPEIECHCNRVTGTSMVMDPNNEVCGDAGDIDLLDDVTVCYVDEGRMVPTVSHWGLLILALALMTAAKVGSMRIRDATA